MSGNADPSYIKDGGFGDFGYDDVSYTNSDISIPPNEYEVRISSKHLKKVADDIGNIPLYLIMDTISLAARNVSILLNRKLEVPPIPIKSIKKQKETNVEETQSPLYNIIEPINIVKVYEIWKVFLEKNDERLDEVYIVVCGDFTLRGYRNGQWSNIEYKGFYTTIEEAQNQISGYLR